MVEHRQVSVDGEAVVDAEACASRSACSRLSSCRSAHRRFAVAQIARGKVVCEAILATWGLGRRLSRSHGGSMSFQRCVFMAVVCLGLLVSSVVLLSDSVCFEGQKSQNSKVASSPDGKMEAKPSVTAQRVSRPSGGPRKMNV